MLKNLSVVLVILLFIGIGSFSFYFYNEVGSKFPSEVIANREPPIEAVKRFVNIRYETLEAVAKGYVLYTEQLSTAKIGDIDLTKNFKWGEYDGSEKRRTTKEIIDNFMKSREGAFIYKESKESIKRNIRDKEKNIKAIYKSAESYETKIEKNLGLYPDWLRYVYHGTYGAKETIMKYDDTSLNELLKSLKTHMNDVNKPELWQALSTQSENEQLQKDFDKSVFNEPIGLFHRNHANFKSLSKDELEVLNLLIVQALRLYPYGRQSAILEDTGVNLYIGEELLQGLNNRVSSALKEVG